MKILKENELTPILVIEIGKDKSFKLFISVRRVLALLFGLTAVLDRIPQILEIFL